METPPPTLRRRNSIDTSAIPTKLILPTNPKSSSFPPSTAATTIDFELASFKSSESYTSLKDLLPPTISAVKSPTGAPATPNSSSAISIRNRLVKQAAWAYLQPMSTSPDSSGRDFFGRIWIRFSGDSFRNPVSACLRFFHRHFIPTITRAFDRLLRAIRVRTHR